jgi:hypothetical protein
MQSLYQTNLIKGFLHRKKFFNNFFDANAHTNYLIYYFKEQTFILNIMIFSQNKNYVNLFRCMKQERQLYSFILSCQVLFQFFEKIEVDSNDLFT